MQTKNDSLTITRRNLLKATALGCGGYVAANSSPAADPEETKKPSANGFELNYMLASCMYGYMYVGEILPEVAKCGCCHLDIWPKKHGNQREQLTGLGEERFAEMLGKHNVKLGCITQYALGPFGLTKEFEVANRFGCRLIVTGGEGPRGLSGAELKTAVGGFVEQMKPHLEIAETNDVTIAIENHANNLFESADSLRYLRDLSPSKYLKVGLAPYHLTQDSEELATLIRDLGDSIAMFYAWQHGKGCMTRLPKEDELLQLPGHGSLDFSPLMTALRDIQYQGWTEIFMHPVPRGIPILETADEVTNEINRSRDYLTECIRKIGRV
jgi:sugar phosphate isomerase/epimerase